MGVIRENGGGPAGVAEPCDRPAKRLGDGLPFGVVEPEDGVLQFFAGVSLECHQFGSWGLGFLSAVVNRAEIGEPGVAEFGGEAPSGVVRQPVAVAGDDEVICEDHGRQFRG